MERERHVEEEGEEGVRERKMRRKDRRTEKKVCVLGGEWRGKGRERVTI